MAMRAGRIMPWKKITSKLMPGITKGIVYMDAFEKAVMVEPGLLPEDYKNFEDWPEHLHHIKVGEDARSLKRAFNGWNNHLQWAQELVAIADRANSSGKPVAITFENLKDYKQDKYRNRPERIARLNDKDEEIILSTSNVTDEDRQELIEYKEAYKPYIETTRRLKVKYDKRTKQ